MWNFIMLFSDAVFNMFSMMFAKTSLLFCYFCIRLFQTLMLLGHSKKNPTPPMEGQIPTGLGSSEYGFRQVLISILMIPIPLISFTFLNS